MQTMQSDAEVQFVTNPFCLNWIWRYRSFIIIIIIKAEVKPKLQFKSKLIWTVLNGIYAVQLVGLLC